MAVKPINIAQLNGYIKRILQTDPLLGNVSVVGEVSNLKFHGSGHVYFTMKDASSKLNCFLPADRVENIRYALSEGMEIVASGYIYLYERGGSYSLNVKDIQVEGMGNLSIAFEKLKETLAGEGLFDESRKKDIPQFPEKVVVITSNTGAAVKDILKIIQNRNEYVDVLVYPVLVQGPAAAGEIADAIDAVNRLFPETDTIIVGRGGGSIEELWPFNEEIVARHIAASQIPIISAVGHETDFTIADFAADLRAETPTAAASLAVPDTDMLREQLQTRKKEMTDSFIRYIQEQELNVQKLNFDIFKQEIESKLVLEQMRIENQKNEMLIEINNKLKHWGRKIDLYQNTLDSLNPMQMMKRGYGAILDSNGKFVSSVSTLKQDDSLTITLSDGKADCKVTDIRRC
jgi:exodeoxyribonuclease VII large subunit